MSGAMARFVMKRDMTAQTDQYRLLASYSIPIEKRGCQVLKACSPNHNYFA
jgi:hypothetical protein